MKKVHVIGLGLIGGSMALDLKERLGLTVIGTDVNPAHCEKALQLGVIDAIATEENKRDADVIIVAIPVDVLSTNLVNILEDCPDNALVVDVGSVKEAVCKAIEHHPKRKNFVAAHPLAGTEFSGPEAAIRNLFDGKVTIICEPEKSDWKVLDTALSMFKHLNMRIKMMRPEEHDRHIAYVSHLSHVSSFMLGKTVLDIEKNEQHIFDMASTGFESTVRLAKSSSRMWAPIFTQNKKNVLTSLEAYIANLTAFKKYIENEDVGSLEKIMDNTNYIKNVLKGIK